jgi:hypothetical protein
MFMLEMDNRSRWSIREFAIFSRGALPKAHELKLRTVLGTDCGSDHDPLYRFYQWQANLPVLKIQEIKTVPLRSAVASVRGEIYRNNPTGILGPNAILDGG